ncbi:MAG: FMN-binding protein [bacterium]|nr:FMN-binding protein [bacterium]
MKTASNGSQQVAQVETTSPEQGTTFPMETEALTYSSDAPSASPVVEEETFSPNTDEPVQTASPSATTATSAVANTETAKTAAPVQTTTNTAAASTKAPAVVSTKAPVSVSTKVPTAAATKTPAISTKAPSVAASKTPTVTATVAPTKAPTAAPAYKDGSYTGSGTGRNGTITVSVRIRDGKIYKITVDDHEETVAIFNLATPILDKIISSQSTNVDAISGATYSSNGLKEAVQNALSKAKN